MTDHWQGLAEQQGRDLARVKDERDRLRAAAKAWLDATEGQAVDAQARVHIDSASRDLLIALGWTPPAGES